MGATARNRLAAAALALAGVTHGHWLPTRAAADTDADAAPSDLLLEAVAARSQIRLGEDVVLRLTLTNRSGAETSVPRLWLSQDAVSVRVDWDGREQAVLARRRGAFEMEQGQMVFRPADSPHTPLPAGSSVTGEIRSPALRVGELRFTAHLARPGVEPLAAAAVRVKVQPVKGVQKVPYVEFATTKGTVRVELDPARSYNSCAHFWMLARDGFFDDLTFHRVVKGLLAQSGDPRGDGSGGPGWYLPAEGHVERFPRGGVGLARGIHPDSAGSQWFLVGTADPEAFRDGYTSLGTVSRGLPVVEQLVDTAVEPGTQTPVSAPRVESATVGTR